MDVRATRPIGVFDSGLGGLTVLRSLAERLPHERLVYLGDTARVPYGTRTRNTVIRYALGCARKLMEYDIKACVVACNTVSAVALDSLRVEFDVPVLGVVGPGARAAARAAPDGRIGVIATTGTVRSGAYPRMIAAENSRIEVVQEAAPLLVPLVEEGWIRGTVPSLAVREYLARLVREPIQALILGCTHYPALLPIFEEELATLQLPPPTIVDSPSALAQELEVFLRARDLLRPAEGADEDVSPLPQAPLQLMVTDMPEPFSELAARFLGKLAARIQVTQTDL